MWLDARKARKMRLERDKVGGGARIPAAKEAIKRAMDSPQRAFVQFSWAGDQTKSVPGVLLTAFEDLAVEHVAPFVTTEPRFANDFDAINVSLAGRFETHPLHFQANDLGLNVLYGLRRRGNKFQAGDLPVHP